MARTVGTAGARKPARTSSVLLKGGFASSAGDGQMLAQAPEASARGPLCPLCPVDLPQYRRAVLGQYSVKGPVQI